MHDPAPATTFLFTDVEGSTRLWESEPERMRPALAAHDAIARAAVESHRGRVVKTIGDGLHAVFADPLDALAATLAFQEALADPRATHGLALRVRCGLHLGAEEARDNDFFGPSVNRAARIMSAAHGGQVLLSEAVASRLRDRLPPGVALRDLGAVRLRDLASPERVSQVLHPRLRRDFPALRSLEATPNNLPQQVASFVGRERELAETRQLLAGTRLLTLTGAGGIGKTRLALQVAADALDEFRDGVWFVELAPLTEPAMVPLAVATALGVREEAGRPLIEALGTQARERNQLIVFDNCEHLVQACAELARALLEAAPHLRLLATTREAMHLAGETTYLVPALATPDARAGAAARGLEPFESVRLFVERARAAQPAFRLTDANAPAVAAICRQLDGIPLALELAAARVRAFSVENIAARLSDRFRLLTRGDRTTLPRQQSLRALIDWSHDLLDERERAMLRRLSIFAGGWTLEAAEAVCADGAVTASDVLDLLSHLVDKSLVVPEAGGERYRMLETVRQYARERLEDAGEKKATRTRHLAYYVAFAAKARPALYGAGQGEWLARLDAERENLVSAHRWCDRAVDGAQAGYLLLDGIKLYWFMRGLLGLGLRLTLEALARPAAQQRDRARCRGLFAAGQFCAHAARYREALGHLQESLAIARERNDDASRLSVLQPLTMTLAGMGELDAALAFAAEALALAQTLGNKHQLMGATNTMAQLRRTQGDLETADALYTRVVAYARDLGDRENIAIGLLNLAMVAIGLGSRQRADALLLEAIEIAEDIQSMPAAQSVLEVCAGLAAMASDWTSSARFYGAAEAQALGSGLRRDQADEAFLAPWMAATRNGLPNADYVAAESAGRALGSALALTEARRWLKEGACASR